MFKVQRILHDNQVALEFMTDSPEQADEPEWEFNAKETAQKDESSHG
jgi:hypothetical protein